MPKAPCDPVPWVPRSAAPTTQKPARGPSATLWHNSLNVADAFGFPKEAMLIDVELGVQRPDQVDINALLGIFPTDGHRSRWSRAVWTFREGTSRDGASSPTPRSWSLSTWSPTMTLHEKRIILEMGSGNDLYGCDYTRRPAGPSRTRCTILRSFCSSRWAMTTATCASR